MKKRKYNKIKIVDWMNSIERFDFLMSSLSIKRKKTKQTKQKQHQKWAILRCNSIVKL